MVLPALEVPATSLETTTSSTAAQALAPTLPEAGGNQIGLILRGAALLLLAGGAVTAFLSSRNKRVQTAVADTGD
jgi:hypothetical protein